MVAYSFKSFFVPQIVAGTKRQTVRSDRKRHAEAGEAIQLYADMRTIHCRKIIPDPMCVTREPIIIERDRPGSISLIEIAGVRLQRDDIEEFARTDGFAPEEIRILAPHLDSAYAAVNMAMFWDLAHGARGLF